MLPENLAEAHNWLTLARQDLRTAEFLLEGGEEYSRSTAFHSQQVVEKALKAYLAFRNQPFPQTHDLAQLRNLCQAIEPEFAYLGADTIVLTTYAVDVRYPGSGSPPTQAEAQQSVEIARQAYDFVASRIPSDS